MLTKTPWFWFDYLISSGFMPFYATFYLIHIKAFLIYKMFLDKTFITYFLKLGFTQKSYELRLITYICLYVCMFSRSKSMHFSFLYVFILNRVFKCQAKSLEENCWINTNNNKKKILIENKHSTIVLNNSCEMQNDITMCLKIKQSKK